MVYVVAEERETVLMRMGDDRHLGYGDPDVTIGTRVDPFTLVRSTASGPRVNDDVGQDEIMAITVAPDKTATVERNW